MNYQKFSLVFGFSVWLIATLIFKFWGHTFFLIESNLLLTGFFLGTIPVLYLLANWVFSQYKLTRDTKLRSAVWMTIPGMICDVVCIKFHSIVFPNLTMEQSVVLAAWVIWAYVILLLIGLINRAK